MENHDLQYPSVWRDLKNRTIIGPSIHGSKHVYPDNKRKQIWHFWKFWNRSKVLEDKYGPYIHGTAPRIAHHALRVEVGPHVGDEKLQPAWHYFGLVRDENNKCALDGREVVCHDGRDRMWDSTTWMDIDRIRSRAWELIQDAATYELLNNNCQNFVAALLISIDPVHTYEKELRKHIQKARLVPKPVYEELGPNSTTTWHSNKGKELYASTDQEEFDKFFTMKTFGHDAWEESKREATEKGYLAERNWTPHPDYRYIAPAAHT